MFAPAFLKPSLTLWILTIGLSLMPRDISAQHMRELNLVLAFDVSASVNDAEFALQRAGTAEALRSDAVATAIEAAPGGIAVAIIQWSSIGQQAMGLDWRILQSAQDVRLYSRIVDDMPRKLPGGGTMIHAGLRFAQDTFETAPGAARRNVIDLSGNGRADDPEMLAEIRDFLISEGFVINGLAVEEDKIDLTNYFYSHLIGGTNAFVETAAEFENFADAMERKLFREISGAVFTQIDTKSMSIAAR